MRFRYCPECGGKLNGRHAGDDGEVPYCTACRKYWFDTFFNCVIVLVYNEFDEIVLCRQPHLSERYATVTSGYITPGETAEEAALRETEEELGIRLEKLESAGTVWFEKGGMLMHAFVGFARRCAFRLSEEVAYAEWVPFDRARKTMYPDGPGNALHVCYRKFLRMRGLDA